MPAWPADLPPPTIERYALQEDESVARTDMESGPARQRRIFTAVPTRVPARWVMSHAQFAYFEAWVATTLSAGAAWFDVSLWNGLELNQVEARFTRKYAAAPRTKRSWEVTGEMEVRQMPKLTAAELEVVAAYGLTDIATATPALHAWLHTTMPAANYW